MTEEEQIARNLEETLDLPPGCLVVQFLVSKTELIIDIKDLREEDEDPKSIRC